MQGAVEPEELCLRKTFTRSLGRCGRCRWAPEVPELLHRLATQLQQARQEMPPRLAHILLSVVAPEVGALVALVAQEAVEAEASAVFLAAPAHRDKALVEEPAALEHLNLRFPVGKLFTFSYFSLRKEEFVSYFLQVWNSFQVAVAEAMEGSVAMADAAMPQPAEMAVLALCTLAWLLRPAVVAVRLIRAEACLALVGRPTA